MIHITDRILRGARPGDIPVQQPTKFELATNVKTAKALSIDNPAVAARPRGRDHRVIAFRSHALLQMLMPRIGPERQFAAMRD